MTFEGRTVCGACQNRNDGSSGKKGEPIVTGGVPLVDEEQLLNVFRALRRFDVEYAVFGGVALGLHGLVRATADLDLFIPADGENIARLRNALRSLFDDPSIEEISEADLCGDYPAVRYTPPEGFSFDILTRLGQAFCFADLEIEEKAYGGVSVRVVTPRTLWLMKRDTIRPVDRMDAEALADRFGLEEE